MKKQFGSDKQKELPLDPFCDVKEMFLACKNGIAGAGVALAGHEAKHKKTELNAELINKWIRRLNYGALFLIFTYVLLVGISMWSAWTTEKYFWEVMSQAERTEIKRRIEKRVLDAGFSKIQGVQYAESTPPIQPEKKGEAK